MAASALRRSDRPRVRVLIVEDDAAVFETLAAAFEEAGIEVEHAASCEAMIRSLRRSAPDVAVVDRHLPDGDGWQTMSDARDRSPRTDLVVIAITSHLALSNAERALLAGCESFLEKPLDPRSVVNEALRLMSRREPKTTTRRKRLRDT
jgi:two-component system OmpR family response regulator